MSTPRDCQQITLVFRRSFCRPVKIRVEAELPRSADRIASFFPAGTLLLTAPRRLPPDRRGIRIIHIESSPQPEWQACGSP
jgi:hypothetical protein